MQPFDNLFSLNYNLDGRAIKAHAIDLNQPWQRIRDDLLQVVA